MSSSRSTTVGRARYRIALNDVVRDNDGDDRGRQSVIVDQAAVDWEGWNDPGVAARSTVRWKLLVDGERGPSGGLVTGVAEIAPGGVLPRHHHKPEETYYVLSGRGVVEIEDARAEIGPGTAVFIPPDARHALHCIGAEPLVFLFTFARDRFEDVVYHFDAGRRRRRQGPGH